MPQIVKRITLIEREPWRRLGFTTYLQNAGFTVEALGSPEKADRTLGVQTHAVLLSQQLLGEDAVAAIAKLAVIAPVLILGEADCLRTAASVIAAGASGYHVFSRAPETLLAAIDVVAAGRIWASREAMVLAVRGTPKAETREVSLDGEEREMLRLLAQGLSNKEIAAELALAEVTVKARLGRLYRRFGVTSRLQMLSAAMRWGLL